MENQKILFEDKDIMITDKKVSIKCYYFPFGNSKNIFYKDIQKVEVRPLIAKLRLWGMDALNWGYWFPGDCSRISRDQFVAIYIGSWVVPSLTTEHTMVVYNIIMSELQKYKNQQNKYIAGVHIQNNGLSQNQNSMNRPMLHQ